MSGRARLVSWLLGVAVICTLVATFVPSLWPLAPRAAMFAPMAAQFAAIAAVLSLLAIVTRRRVLAALSIVALAWNLWAIWPDVWPHQDAQQAGTDLKVLHFNVWFRNDDIDATVDYLAKSGADVIGLVEVSAQFKRGVDRLKAIYPYGVDCIDTLPKCQTMLLSKYPLKNAYAGPIDQRFPYIAIAEVQLPNAPVTVAVTHLSWPFVVRQRPLLAATTIDPLPATLPDTPALEQSVQAANLAAFLATEPNDLVLMGDFNSASWSPLLNALRQVTGLDERRRLLLTWPSWAWPIFRLPIDHILARGRARVASVEAGPATGSDHLPVVAKIAIAP